MKPEDGQYTRKGERDGKKLSPGERAVHWAKALAIIIPLLGIGAFADEPVKRWFKGGTIAEVDHHTEITEGGMTFKESVIKNSQEVRAELDAIKAQLKKINSHTTAHDSELQQQITKWHGND